MCNNNTVQDPLKPLDQIFDPDSRQAHFVGTLKDRHNAISIIQLSHSVPLAVRQLFETSKNLSLYSWFVYRFHQVSEMVAYSALEMALRDRYRSENPGETKRTTLYFLLQHAKQQSWIRNKDFPSLMMRAKARAEHKKFMDTVKDKAWKDIKEFTLDDPTEAEILESMEDLDLVTAITETTHKLRNELAHGSTNLHPASISTLQIVAEIINQVFHPAHDNQN